ncbi:MAG: TonB-dependent receptor [Bacteroidia bacterium]|nr:TonB-dependent receptor [Bacteroidia bacterium]
MDWLTAPARYRRASGGVQRDSRSPSYFLLNAQITKKYKDWEVYVGGENLGNFTQANPIIDPQNPYGEHFDSGIVYAPIQGRMFYAGFRFTVN